MMEVYVQSKVTIGAQFGVSRKRCDFNSLLIVEC